MKYKLILAPFLLIALITTSHAQTRSIHPIYFTGGDVKDGLKTFQIPAEQLEAGVLYDLTCTLTKTSITNSAPIILFTLKTGNSYIRKIYLNDEIAERMVNTSYYVINQRVSLQEQITSPYNTVTVKRFSCRADSENKKCANNTDLLTVYNFDDTEIVSLSNCYIKVSQDHA